MGTDLEPVAVSFDLILKDTGFGSHNTVDRIGRGASLRDLNSDILRKIYWNLRRFVGRDAGDEFVKMVRDVPVLSAVSFMDALIAFRDNTWRWDKSLLKYCNGKSHHTPDVVAGAGALAAALQEPRDDTALIREPFLADPSGGKTIFAKLLLVAAVVAAGAVTAGLLIFR